MIGGHFHANMTAVCKDDDNSKSKAAKYVKFDIYKMVLVDYIQSIKFSIFNISVEVQDVTFIKVRRQKSSFRDTFSRPYFPFCYSPCDLDLKPFLDCRLEAQADLRTICFLKGQLQRFYKLISYERAVKILKNDIYIYI